MGKLLRNGWKHKNEKTATVTKTCTMCTTWRDRQCTEDTFLALSFQQFQPNLSYHLMKVLHEKSRSFEEI